MNNVVIYRSGLSGGTGTFAIRLSKELMGRGYTVYYVLKEHNDVNNEQSLKDLGIQLLSPEECAKNFNQNENFTIISYTLEEYCEAARLFSKLDNKVMLLYPLMNGHTGETFSGVPVLSSIGKAFSRRYFKFLYENNAILFTTPKQQQKYEKFYHLDHIEENEYFIIPIDVKRFSTSMALKRYRDDKRIIITVLRTEFPLRGYVFGLIEDSIELWKLGYKFSLKIIASGEGVGLIREKLGEYDNGENAIVIEGCSYTELTTHMNSAFLNIGHGTSVLDASSCGVPSLVALQLSYLNKTSGLFSEIKTITGSENDGFDKHTFFESLKGFLEYDEQEYVDLSQNEYDYTASVYSMSVFVSKLLNRDSQQRNKKLNYYSPIYHVKTVCDKKLIAIKNGGKK